MRTFDSMLTINCELKFRRYDDTFTSHASMSDVEDLKTWIDEAARLGKLTNKYRLVLFEPKTKFYWKKILAKAALNGSTTCCPLYLYVDAKDADNVYRDICDGINHLGRWSVVSKSSVKVKTSHV